MTQVGCVHESTSQQRNDNLELHAVVIVNRVMVRVFLARVFSLELLFVVTICVAQHFEWHNVTAPGLL